MRQFGLGWSKQLVGKKLEEVYPPELAESYRQQLERVLETGLTVEFEHPMSEPDGEHTHLDTLYPIYRYGLVWAVGGACHDISQRKRSELARKEREERLRSLIESTPDSIFIKDRSLCYTLVNSGMARLLGLPVEQIIGKRAADLFGKEATARLERIERRVLEGEIVEEIDTRLVRGEIHNLHVLKAPLRDESGKVTGLTGIVRDITDRLEAGGSEKFDPDHMSLDIEGLHASLEQIDQQNKDGKIKGDVSVNHDVSQTRQTELQYRLLFENMLDGFAHCKLLYEDANPEVASDFVYLAVNGAFEQLTGLKEAVGKRVSQLIPGLRQSNPELFEFYSRVAQTGASERLETYVEPLGIWFSVSAYSIQKDYFTAVFENITERKRAEALLQDSLSEKVTLLKEVHHRVRNNLAVISALLDMQARLSQDPRVQEAFTDSQQRILAMSAIHEQLYRSNDLRRIDMASYLEKMVHDLMSVYARRQVAMRLEIDQVSLPIDQAIPCGLIINELVTNALKYAFDAGNAKPGNRKPHLHKSRQGNGRGGPGLQYCR